MRLSQAATRYQARFGRRPTVCWINAADLNGSKEDVEVKGLRLQALPKVLRHHI